MSIAAFDIHKARDKTGKEIEPVHEFQAGLNRQVAIYPTDFVRFLTTPQNCSQPKPFRCSITPRSEKAAMLIQSVLEEHPFPEGDGELVKAL